MSKLTDSVLKNLLLDALNNVDPKDVLSGANLPFNGTNVRSVKSSIKKLSSAINAAVVDCVDPTGDPSSAQYTSYKNTYIKDVKTVQEVRQNGRKSKDGVPTPEVEWGHYELLSFFFELYFKRTGHEFPLEVPGVRYLKYVKSTGKWEPKVTRGLGVMNTLLKAFGSIDQTKAYLEWWFASSFNNKPISWGWISSATMISMFQSRLSVVTASGKQPTVVDTRLPDEFVEWSNGLDGIRRYIGEIKTVKQLMYVFNAWKDQMHNTDNPVVMMLNRAIESGILEVK